jgi:hypothetical protein
MVVDHLPLTAGLDVNTLDSLDPRWSDSDFFSFVRALQRDEADRGD